MPSVLDAFAVRPLMLYLCPMLFGHNAGMIVGGLSADIIFYALAFIIHKLASRRG